MPEAHRDSDTRNCGATTIVGGQSTVFVNGLLWAVEGDPESHGNGNLISVVGSSVFIGGIKVIVLGDTATSDNALHNPPSTDPNQGSSDVFAY